jgi:hypothetical protein
MGLGAATRDGDCRDNRDQQRTLKELGDLHRFLHGISLIAFRGMGNEACAPMGLVWPTEVLEIQVVCERHDMCAGYGTRCAASVRCRP